MRARHVDIARSRRARPQRVASALKYQRAEIDEEQTSDTRRREKDEAFLCGDSERQVLILRYS